MNNMCDEDKKQIIEKNVFSIIGKKQMYDILFSGNEVNLKFGIDPSSDFFHIGHMSCLLKIEQFLLLFDNVKVQFVLGTGTIFLHDPASMRTRNTSSLVLNSVVDKANKLKQGIQTFFNNYLHRISFHYNHEWLINSLDISKVVAVAKKISLQDMASKFKRRNITVSHAMYSIFQAYDSFILQNDIELGGSDQLYNILLARENFQTLQCKHQVAFFLNLLTNSDGDKMSKSFGSALCFDDALHFWRKVFSLKDNVFFKYVKHFDMSEDTTRENFANFFINKIFTLSEQIELKNKQTLWQKSALQEEFIKLSFVLKNDNINLIDLICSISSLTRSEVRRRIKANAVKVNNVVCNKHTIDACDSITLSFGKMEKYLCSFSIP